MIIDKVKHRLQQQSVTIEDCKSDFVKGFAMGQMLANKITLGHIEYLEETLNESGHDDMVALPYRTYTYLMTLAKEKESNMQDTEQ